MNNTTSIISEEFQVCTLLTQRDCTFLDVKNNLKLTSGQTSKIISILEDIGIVQSFWIETTSNDGRKIHLDRIFTLAEKQNVCPHDIHPELKAVIIQ